MAPIVPFDPLHRAQEPSSRSAKSYHEVFHHSDAPRSDVDVWEQGDVTALPPPPAPPRAHLAVSFGISSARNNGAAGGEPDYEDPQDVREFVASELVCCASFSFFALALRPVDSWVAPLFFGLAWAGWLRFFSLRSCCGMLARCLRLFSLGSRCASHLDLR